MLMNTICRSSRVSHRGDEGWCNEAGKSFRVGARDTARTLSPFHSLSRPLIQPRLAKPFLQCFIPRPRSLQLQKHYLSVQPHSLWLVGRGANGSHRDTHEQPWATDTTT